MIRKFIAAFVLMFIVSSSAFAADEAKVIQVTAADEPKVIQVTGYGIPPSNWDARDSFVKTFARQAARMDALRNLAEAIGTIHVQTKTTFDPDGNLEKDIVKTELIHDSKVFKLLTKNARQVGDAKFSFGDDGSLMCEVTMEVVVPADWGK